MKKLALLSMLLALGLFVAGCGETKSPPAKPAPNPSDVPTPKGDSNPPAGAPTGDKEAMPEDGDKPAADATAPEGDADEKAADDAAADEKADENK